MLRLPLAAAVVVAALISVPTADAAWTAPAVVHPEAESKDVALAAGGHVTAALERNDRGAIAERAPWSASWSFTDTPEAGLDRTWELDTDRAGTTYGFTLIGSSRVGLATKPRGGSFGPVVPVSEPATGTVSFSQAVSDGGAVAVALLADSRIVVRVGAAGEPLGEAVDLGAGQTFTPAVAVADDGQAVVAWRVGDGPAHIRLRAADGTWSPARTITGVSVPLVAMNARGDALVAWRDWAAFRAVRRPAGGELGDVVEIAPDGAGVNHPRPLVAPDGTMLVLTDRDVRVGEVFRGRVDAVPVTAAGAGTPVPIAGTDLNPTLIDGRVDAQGRTWIAWSSGEVLHVTRQADDGSFPAGVDVSRGERVKISYVDLGLDGHGGAAVTWNTYAGDTMRIAEWPGPRDARPGTGRPAPGGGQPGQPAPQPPAVGLPGPAAGAPRAQTPGRGTVVRQALTGLTVTRKGRRATVRFRLRTAATVTLTVERAQAGRRSRGRCVKPTAGTRRRAACTRWVTVGRKVVVRAGAGANRATLTVGRLKRGRYRITARSGAARASATLR
jgi:hypothetical protein